MFVCDVSVFFFFFNDTATTEIYTLSLHDALPISLGVDAPLALAHPDFAGKAACKLGELGGGAGMQAQFIADGYRGLDHWMVADSGSEACSRPPASPHGCLPPRHARPRLPAPRGDSRSEE